LGEIKKKNRYRVYYGSSVHITIYFFQSKGCILAKACEYILELRDSSEKAADLLRENERLANHVEYLQSVNDKLKVENSLLRRAPGSNIRPSSSHES